MTNKTYTSTSKGGSCKKMVKVEDPSGIVCVSCGVWYHGCSCGGLSQDNVTVMGRIRGCLWICSVCLNDDVFTSEAKLNSLIVKKEFKILVKSIQNSLDEIETKLEPAHKVPKAPPSGEPTCREILISGLVENKGNFHSTFEADDFKMKEIFQHIGEPMLSIETTRRLGRPQRDSKSTRPLNDYSTAIYLFDEYSSHMFLLIYNPPTSSPYRIQADSLIDCISSYFNDDLVSSNSFTILGDINLVDVCWATITAHSDYSKAIL